MDTLIAGLKLRGKFVGVAPATTTVYADRDALGEWEQVEITRRVDGRFLVRFRSADLVLSVIADGSLDTRPAGTDAAWEQARGAALPPDWPEKLIYDNGVALDVVRG